METDFLEHDRTKTEGPIETELISCQFPSAEELYKRYKTHKGISEEKETNGYAPIL
jgi:hypothetical protein